MSKNAELMSTAPPAQETMLLLLLLLSLTFH